MMGWYVILFLILYNVRYKSCFVGIESHAVVIKVVQVLSFIANDQVNGSKYSIIKYFYLII